MAVAVVQVLVLSLCAGAMSQTFAAGCGTKTIGGANLGGGTYTNLDTTTGLGYLAKGYVVDCCGVLTAWKVHIQNTGTIHLQVWRESGTRYTLVTSNTYTFSTADQLIVQTLTIAPSLQATILAGDLIGWYATGVDMVPYASGSIENLQKNPGSTSGTVDFASGSILNGRDYAISFTTGDNSPPRFTTLPDKISFLDTKSVGGVTLYRLTATDDNKDDTDLTEKMTTTNAKFILDLRLRVKISQSNWIVGDYTLDYRVTDQCDNEGTSTLTISVNNTNPVITSSASSYDVREDNDVETQIMLLTVTDKQTYTCTKSSASPEDGSFVVKQTSATSAYGISLLGGKAHPNILDYDTKPQYTIVVSCTDDLGLTTEKTIYLNVVRNEPPVINVLPTEVSKSTLTTTTGTQIYQVDVTDAENDALQYTMSCSPSTCPFTMNENTGEITANQDLNLHKITPYEVYVTVNDGHRSTGPETLTVKLTDINDLPVISNLGVTSLTQTIDENSGVAAAVYDVDFTDDNIGDTHTFSATYSPTTCQDMYTINTNTGVVSTLTDFDYEDLLTKGLVTCDLIVTVDDDRESSTVKRLRVVVNDVNEQQTGFRKTLYFITADEGQPGTVIQDPGFIVDDPDNNDVQTYTMDCGTRQTYFSLDESTGIITQTREYDLDADNRRFNTARCTVTATDKGGHTVTTRLNILINEINDNPPVLNKNKYDFVVAQNAPAGTTILGQCISTDEDVKTEHTDHTYSIDGSTVLVANACTMKLAADVSGYPVGTKFEQTLTATDIGGLTDTAAVCVVIIDPTTSSAATTQPSNTNTNNGGSVTGTGDSGSPAAFLSNPADLAWFIPAMIALAVMAALLGYMIYRCCRVPGFCSRLFSDMCGCFNDKNCCARGHNRGSGKISDAKDARKENASSEKSEPRSKGKKVEKPSKPINIRDPDKIEGKYEWNSWAHTDFSNAKVEYR